MRASPHSNKRCRSCVAVIGARETACGTCLSRERERAVARAGRPGAFYGGQDESKVRLAMPPPAPARELAPGARFDSKPTPVADRHPMEAHMRRVRQEVYAEERRAMHEQDAMSIMAYETMRRVYGLSDSEARINHKLVPVSELDYQIVLEELNKPRRRP